MEYRVWAHRKADGSCQVREKLDEWRLSNPQLWAIVVRGIERLRIGAFLHGKQSKSLTDHPYLLELRAGEARLLYGYRPGRLILLLHLLAKKQDELRPRDIRHAERAYEDH